MHGQDRNAAVNDIHTVKGKNIGDRAPAAHVDPADLGGLGQHAGFFKETAQMGDIFGIGVVAAQFSSGTRELGDDQAPAQIRRVFGLKTGSVTGIKGAADIRGQHTGGRQGPAQAQLAVLAAQLHDLGQGILKKAGPHAGGAYAADLLLVHQQGAGSPGRQAGLHLGTEAGIGTDTVILGIAEDHAPVEACLPGPAGRHDLQLRGFKIRLIHIIVLFQDGHNGVSDRVLSGRLFALSARFCIGVNDQGLIAHDQIQGFPFNDFGSRLFQLLLGQMDQKI